MASYKNPPVFDPKSISYESWKNEIDVWRRITDLPPNKQALAVSLTLSGKARDIAMDVSASELNDDKGMNILLAQLDTIFLKEKKDLAYEAYRNFDCFKKSLDMDMGEYIIQFEQLYTKSTKYDMTLPDAVLAFKLMDNANLSDQERQLALTACNDLNFNSMKSALRRVFGDKYSASSEFNSVIKFKQESAFLSQHKKFNNHAGVSSGLPKGTNPLNRFGKRTKCAICQSVFHWAKSCPEKQASVNVAKTDSSINSDDCHLTLFTKDKLSDHEIFVVEALGSAVLDTACTRTVCGEKWFSHYMSCLSEDERDSISIHPSKRTFKFGDGNIVQSIQRCIIPVQIGRTICNIDTEVVKSDIPLLLSKESLKKAQTVLDLPHDKAVLFGEEISLERTSSGHYCLNILRDEPATTEDVVLTISPNMTAPQKEKVVSKLHKQFGHASIDRLSRLLKSADIKDPEIFDLLQKTVDACEVCKKLKKPSPKPAVGFPLASDFNETVAVDLHELEPGVWYLHIMDEFTRFSAGSIMLTKKSSEFIQKFLQCWLCVHGAPKCLYSDNGGEFNNKEVRDMAENFNIEIKTTPAYSPWSNGCLERHNQTLTDMLLKIKCDQDCDWETALNWALMAKNALNNVHGFSPYQLVFGRLPNLPSVLIDKPPALEGTTMSAIVAKHISTLHAARSAYTKAECSERVRRALRKQVRPSNIKFHPGDKVFYKRPDSREWKGPGTVIGTDGVVVFVRHGGSCVRVHQ